ncbi:MAG: hypothetical protein MUF87_17595 [Anaerolineae bacterium]|jgi:hypothetical protein|nr:hypothetical protein [Anaerolineae bacterium]
MTQHHPPLIIDYLTEGPQRGYSFTTPTHAYSDETIKSIWRNAMPRGQGWAAYIGAKSLKSFVLPDKRIVIAQTEVTDRADESGRRGIRRTQIEVFAPADYRPALTHRLGQFNAGLQQDADFHLAQWRKTAAFERLGPQIKRAHQLIFTHAFSTLADWQVIEVLLLKIAIHPPYALRQFGNVLSFTTLALAPHEESLLTALPADRAATLSKIPSLAVT